MTARLFTDGDDLARLAEIHRASLSVSWDTRAIGELLATPGTFAFCLEKGFILARVSAEEAEILTLAVRPECRRRGQGAALVHATALHAFKLGADRIFLEVGVDNVAACALYAALGFTEVGRRKDYYAVGPNKREDALILRSNLPLSPLGKRRQAR